MKLNFSLRSVFPMLLLSLMIGFSACKDECKDVNCQNGGICDAGDCTCADGYEGTLCESEIRAKFLGSYNTNENCNLSGNFNYQIAVTTSATGIKNIIITNFYGIGVSVSATISGNSVSIPNQTVVDGAGDAYTLSGGGQLNGNILTLTYAISSGGVGENCTATCTKL